jgi:small subunit ribosomal protein S7
MSRSKIVREKHYIKPDYKYSSVEISKFINFVMKDGKKEVSEKIVYEMLERINDLLSEKFGKELSMSQKFSQFINYISPEVGIRKRRIGGTTCSVPYMLNDSQKIKFAFSALISSVRKKVRKSSLNTVDILVDEAKLALSDHGDLIKLKEEQRKIASANNVYQGLI